MRDPAPGAMGTAVQDTRADASPAGSSKEDGPHVAAGWLWHGKRTSGSAEGYDGAARSCGPRLTTNPQAEGAAPNPG